MDKKIGTITFHWANNYGAVLQAYALQQFLIKNGFETEIIDYLPGRIVLIQRISLLRHHDGAASRREHELKKFRKKELLLSRRYYSFRELKKCGGRYGAVIAGSDQIWNESFTLGAEGKPTLSYFLDFLSDDVKRISYAVSFGTDQVSSAYKNAVLKAVKKFKAVSVRETSGRAIIESFGISGTVVCDPSLLLERSDYEKLIKNYEIEAPRVFSYILHGDHSTKEVSYKVKNIYCNNHIDIDPNYSLYEWLCYIRNSEIVVTNSFHGIMLSLIFNTPFAAVLMRGSGMNSRITTILSKVGLENRIIEDADIVGIKKICDSEIDWECVNQKLEDMRYSSQKFLLNSLK